MASKEATCRCEGGAHVQRLWLLPVKQPERHGCPVVFATCKLWPARGMSDTKCGCRLLCSVYCILFILARLASLNDLRGLSCPAAVPRQPRKRHLLFPLAAGRCLYVHSLAGVPCRGCVPQWCVPLPTAGTSVLGKQLAARVSGGNAVVVLHLPFALCTQQSYCLPPACAAGTDGCSDQPVAVLKTAGLNPADAFVSDAVYTLQVARYQAEEVCLLLLLDLPLCPDNACALQSVPKRQGWLVHQP